MQILLLIAGTKRKHQLRAGMEETWKREGMRSHEKQ
jgi:hypothetical protein